MKVLELKKILEDFNFNDEIVFLLNCKHGDFELKPTFYKLIINENNKNKKLQIFLKEK